jgi:hypothetical protein
LSAALRLWPQIAGQERLVALSDRVPFERWVAVFFDDDNYCLARINLIDERSVDWIF